MLFKRKDNSDAAKAKASFFARKTKQEEGALDLSKEAPKPIESGARGRGGEAAGATVKQTHAAGKVRPDILKRPRITEKAGGLALRGVYVFDIAKDANKTMVAAAVKDVYGVSVRKVRIARVPAKAVRSRRGHKGVKSGGTKAYVYLKQGETIELI